MSQPVNASPILLSVVMPAYNEEPTLRESAQAVLNKVRNLGELIIVDDGSGDGTGEIADQLALEYPQVRVIHQNPNQGKTAALKAGFAASRGEVVIVQDADLEYDPAEIELVIEPILMGVADVVYGSRFMVRKASRALYFYHFLANKGLTFLSNMFTNVNMTDVETCYKAFRGEIIRNMIVQEKQRDYLKAKGSQRNHQMSITQQLQTSLHQKRQKSLEVKLKEEESKLAKTIYLEKKRLRAQKDTEDEMTPL